MKRRYILLVRHAEAEKNVRGQFAGNDAADALTQTGEAQAASLVNQVRKLLAALQTRAVAVAYAGSLRAKETARALEEFSAAEPILVPQFRSIQAGVAAGLTEQDLAVQFPAFWTGLQLYREGVLSSYCIPYPPGAEDVRDFEASVMNALIQCTGESSSDLQIVIAHRSSITAILLYYARLSHKYPDDFFGFIPLEAGRVSLIEITAGDERIHWINRMVTEELIKFYFPD